MFEMSFNRSGRSCPYIIIEGHEPERLMSCFDGLNEFSYHTARALKEIIAQYAKIMDAWMQALDKRDGEDAKNKDEVFPTEDEKLELDRKRAQTTEGPTGEFAIHSEVPAMIMAEMKH